MPSFSRVKQFPRIPMASSYTTSLCSLIGKERKGVNLVFRNQGKVNGQGGGSKGHSAPLCPCFMYIYFQLVWTFPFSILTSRASSDFRLSTWILYNAASSLSIACRQIHICVLWVGRIDNVIRELEPLIV